MIQDKSKLPIQILVSHEWEKNCDEIVPVRQDKRWIGIRDLIKKVTNDVEKRLKDRPGEKTLEIQIKRLRGQHGQFILNALIDRIDQGDILIVDIGGERYGSYNPNVLIELGIALGMGKLHSENLFILKPVGLNWPSDLQGILYTEYELEKNTLKLKDSIGFHAALRGCLINTARQKNMIGSSKKPLISIEGFDEATEDTNY
jgi:hypothetical protein